MKNLAISSLCAGLMPMIALAQRRDSERFALGGDWKPVASALRDGTVVEMMETYGTAPWYGRFRWTKDHTVTDAGGKVMHFQATESWVNVDEPGYVVGEECLLWRPYKGTGKYTDPTNHAQKSVAYWCASMYEDQ
jgi:hypothetical protein